MADKQVVIQTKLGQLRGSTKRSVLTEKPYYAFQGIPYAKPPLGDLRFKAPQPYGSWEGIRDALEDGPDPKQPSMGPVLESSFYKECIGEEDCLYMNIFINELPEKSSHKKPVLLSIHGGGFLVGTGGTKMCNGDFLLYGDVVVVSFNYRCGAFGFLSMENEEVPGNAGLKDQTLAMKWVHDNIDSFGGDPNNVTIFRISAGGASVQFHLLSPSSKGLFNKAIIQSGFILSPWAIQQNPRARAIKLARTLGCTSENLEEILCFLRSVSADDIVLATKKMSKEKESYRTISLLFKACVEVSGSEPFLSEAPDSRMKRGEFAKVPVILGCCVKEATSLAIFNGINEEAFTIWNENPEWLVPSFLGLKPGSAEAKDAEVAIKDFYFKAKPISWDNVQQYLLCQGDILYNFGMDLTRTRLFEHSSAPLYTYLFTNHTRCICVYMMQMLPSYSSIIVQADTCHGADLPFIYGGGEGPPLSPSEKEAIKKHIKAWATFAATGDPNSDELGEKWKKDSKSDPCYMDIGATWSMKDGIVFPARINFWRNLCSKYNST